MEVGSRAPDFTLKDRKGNDISLHNLKARFIVVYFYPKDDTAGCTLEAQEFTFLLDKFRKANANIVGISGLDSESKDKFCAKYNLKVTLLADPDFETCKAYGVYGEKQYMGKSYMGIFRTTFVLDKSRKIIKKYTNIQAAGHAKEVLEFIKSF